MQIFFQTFLIIILISYTRKKLLSLIAFNLQISTLTFEISSRINKFSFFTKNYRPFC